jgi:hypothetical protein
VRIQEPFAQNPNLSMLAKFDGVEPPAEGDYVVGAGASLEGIANSGSNIERTDGTGTDIKFTRPDGRLKLTLGPASVGISGTIECSP